MTQLDVIYTHPGGRGWGQIERLAELAESTLGGRLLQVDGSQGYTKLQMARSLVPAPKRLADGRACLVIAPHPAHLSSILLGRQWRRRYSKVVGWVIDSFWVDRVPRVARESGYFDHLYVTGQEDVDAWSAASASPVSALPWGSDALNMPFVDRHREIDLQRVGRQPSDWDDDEATKAAAQAHGLRFAGRPPFGRTDLDSRSNADEALAGAKFTLAFSNLEHSSEYTHPTREYITGRWLDALAAGTTVAGRAPDTSSTRSLLWPEALHQFESTSLAEGLDSLHQAVERWTPATARTNRRLALEHLDWRHRLDVLRKELALTTPQLDSDLAALRVESARLAPKTASE